jgi:hypothetical protein
MFKATPLGTWDYVDGCRMWVNFAFNQTRYLYRRALNAKGDANRIASVVESDRDDASRPELGKPLSMDTMQLTLTSQQSSHCPLYMLLHQITQSRCQLNVKHFITVQHPKIVDITCTTYFVCRIIAPPLLLSSPARSIYRACVA